ncbi:MAG: inositol monophosphatase [Acidimicrobiia bacterium]|nr:inositol monophosphatase [Acidimicrobiia bacterium]
MDDLTLAIDAARIGAAIVHRHFGRQVGTDLKGRNNPVTVADTESEAAIVALLQGERPGDTVLAEESGLARDGGAGRRWLVDPLDGTVNFVHGIPQVSVSIALYEDDVPLVGVVLDVMRAELFTAQSGEGAHLDGAPIQVSSIEDLALSVVSTGFPYDHHQHPAEYAATVAAMLAKVNGIRRTGSAALDLAWVAAGRLDAHWEYLLAPWDMAAGTILVREAGGRVTTATGTDLIPEDRHIVASNGIIHDALVSIIEPTLPVHVRTTTNTHG